nr:ABC transporter permease [Saprospiraceae bacterium]
MIERFIYDFGRYILLLGQSFGGPRKTKTYFKEIVRHMHDIGIGSLVIVALISLFIGAVTAVQFAYQLGGTLIPRYYIGYIVRDMTIIELAPTITCLVLAGKVGSNIASEIGGMRQKEHIDAMEIMGVNTASYLILPRMIAGLTMIPLLVFMAASISIAGAYLASVPMGFFSGDEFVKGLGMFYDPYNVFMMFVKSVVFAFIVITIPAYQGYFVKGGSIELGNASTAAVVFSNIFILLSDYIIALILTS